jgi:hypothetical protein
MDPTTIQIIAIVIALLPAVVASFRHHRNRLAIDVLAVASIAVAVGGFLFLGIGSIAVGAAMWFVALVWSCTSNIEPRRTSTPAPTKSVDPRWQKLRSVPVDNPERLQSTTPPSNGNPNGAEPPAIVRWAWLVWVALGILVVIAIAVVLR